MKNVIPKNKKFNESVYLEDMLKNIGLSTTLFIVSSKRCTTYKLYSQNGFLVYLDNSSYDYSFKDNKNKKINSKFEPKILYNKHEFISLVSLFNKDPKKESKYKIVN